MAKHFGFFRFWEMAVRRLFTSHNLPDADALMDADAEGSNHQTNLVPQVKEHHSLHDDLETRDFLVGL